MDFISPGLNPQPARLQEALHAAGPALLEVLIDPNERVGANPKAVGLYT